MNSPKFAVYLKGKRITGNLGYIQALQIKQAYSTGQAIIKLDRFVNSLMRKFRKMLDPAKVDRDELALIVHEVALIMHECECRYKTLFPNVPFKEKD